MAAIIVIVFVIGYLAIAFEHSLKINKAASALLTGVISWTIYAMSGGEHELVSENLSQHLSEIAGILFFLLGAMVIVELIDAHDGFEIITERIRSTNKKKLVWMIGLITFFLSSVLDDLNLCIVVFFFLLLFILLYKYCLIIFG